MAYYQQHGGYGGSPPQHQPMYGGGGGGGPPSYQSHVQHSQQAPHQQYHHGQGQYHQQAPYQALHHGGGGDHGAHPMQHHLKRQASQLRTQYPDTRWCAVYVDYSTSKNEQKQNDYIDENELLSPIPKTSASGVDLNLENDIMNDVLTWQDRDESEAKRFQEQREAIQKQKEEEKAKKEEKENEMIAEYINISGVNDKNSARAALEKHNWNLQEAVQNVNFSSPNVMANDGHGIPNFGGYNLSMSNNNNNNSDQLEYGGNYGNNNNNNNNNNNSNSTVLKLTLPNSESMNLNMEGSNTIWDLYAKLLQSRPEFSQKPFTFQLVNGQKLEETEFDTTLRTLNLVPHGEIRVVY